MKICQISTVHPLNDNRVFHKECKTLARAGHSVTLIITHEQNEVIDGVRIVALIKRKNRLRRMLLAPLQALRYAFREKADVYHFHDPELIPVCMVLKMAGKKVIYDVHENTAQQMLNKKYLDNKLKKKLAFGLVRFAESLSKLFFDVIIVARPDIAEHWNCSKVRTVINAAVLKTIDEAPVPKITADKPVVVYAGGLTDIRGIRQLIQAMEIIGDRAELWLIGGWQSEDFRKECEQLSGWKQVKYLGYMTVEQVFGYMKKSDIAVVTFLPVPNHLTTLPNKPFEYMACHLPVVMSDFDYWKEIFGDNVLFSNPGSPQEVASQIDKLLGDSDLRKTLSGKGRKLVEEKYSWEAESEKLFEIYNALAKK